MSQKSDAKSKERPGEPFRTTIDGEEYQTSAHELTVREILGLVPLNPETHLLVQIQGRKQEKHENLDQVIKINSGLKFVSVSREPTPVA